MSERAKVEILSDGRVRYNCGTYRNEAERALGAKMLDESFRQYSAQEWAKLAVTAKRRRRRSGAHGGISGVFGARYR